MSSLETKRHIMSFMYGERLKSALLIAGQLLDVLVGLEEGERTAGLKMLASFVRGVGGEMRLAANVMKTQDWQGLCAQLNLMEGYARLGQMEAAREELGRTLSRVTTLSGRAMTSLVRLGIF